MWNLHECIVTRRHAVPPHNLSAHPTTNTHTHTLYTSSASASSHCEVPSERTGSLPQSKLVQVWVKTRRLRGLLFAVRVKFSVRMWKMLHRGIKSCNHYTTQIKGWSNYFLSFTHIYECMWTTCLVVWLHWCSSRQKHTVWNREMIFNGNFALSGTLIPSFQSGYVI